MHEDKLYYRDCHMKTFEAVVTGCEKTENGYEIILDQTAFYPEGGGQACDLGTLADANVLHVGEKNGAVVHLCDKSLETGQRIQGVLDWDRRFDLMQQHTGEHIVSGIIHRMYGYHNVGFHIGAEAITIDFDGPVPQEALPAIEWEANQRVWENVPVRCWYPGEEELPAVPYRTKRQLPWPVRIVQIPEADSCACCGVHVASTGEIGLIKLLSCVKFHQGVRIEMLCGGRALEYLGKVYEQNRQVSQAFSAKLLETGTAARKMNDTLAAEKYRAAGLQRELFAMTAAGYADAGNVLHFAQDLSPAAVRELAEAIAGVCGGVAAVFSGGDGRYDVCLARPGGDVKALGGAMAAALDGRGGGKPGFFQGSVKAERQKIEAFFREI